MVCKYETWCYYWFENYFYMNHENIENIVGQHFDDQVREQVQQSLPGDLFFIPTHEVMSERLNSFSTDHKGLEDFIAFLNGLMAKERRDKSFYEGLLKSDVSSEKKKLFDDMWSTHPNELKAYLDELVRMSTEL